MMETRILYVPEGVSWDEQIARGYKLVQQGYSVQLHEHSMLAPCGLVPEHRCYHLTDDGQQPILESHSKAG